MVMRSGRDVTVNFGNVLKLVNMVMIAHKSPETPSGMIPYL